MAEHLDPGAPLIAETGGLNAMIVDSTALPEQAVQAIVESAFQSAGQRCSALRCLYVQEDIAEAFTEMLTGAMDALVIGDPWTYGTDVGPAIDAEARDGIISYVDAAEAEGGVLHRLPLPDGGTFVPPTLIKVSGIKDMEREIFGPVLHIATFKSKDIDTVIDAINATGYGLTFGLQTRIDDRVQHISERIKAGNIYVNRNQIGAIVGSQPFGGEGLSGTGPKAGGPNYLARFRKHPADAAGEGWTSQDSKDRLTKVLASADAKTSATKTTLPGPTGESNVLTSMARGPILCLGPGADTAVAQAQAVEALGGKAVVAAGSVDATWLADLPMDGAIWWGDADTARELRAALASRTGPILPLITGMPDKGHACHERHVCVDTTASGGNAQLLSGAA
jgi:RHH-type proline utilization regulon transcriptional repressor/proline dehydrogenase/delta 1-pyrroline-5-carboxylate dehydrogenase